MPSFKVLYSILFLGLTLGIAGCSRKQEPKEVHDLNAVRADLKEKVASGNMTREEAIVRLAEATKEAKFGPRSKDKGKNKVELSPELEALGKDLKERIAKGELTEEEAKKLGRRQEGRSRGKAKRRHPRIW